MLKRQLLLIGISILLICSLIVVFYATSFPVIPLSDHRDPRRIINVQFIDGGMGNDTAVITISNELNKTVEISGGTVNKQEIEVSGDLIIQRHSTGTITLTMPTDSVVLGKQYTFRLTTHKDEPWNNPIVWSERNVFYHMYHPNATGPVEEGVIVEIVTGGYWKGADAYMLSTNIRNTGDFPITITSGFVNGIQAMNVTGAPTLIIAVNATEQVSLFFPPGSFYEELHNGTPIYVSLVTARNNTIVYAEPPYIQKEESNSQQTL
jgi:ubiquitin-protein ligase